MFDSWADFIFSMGRTALNFAMFMAICRMLRFAPSWRAALAFLLVAIILIGGVIAAELLAV